MKPLSATLLIFFSGVATGILSFSGVAAGILSLALFDDNTNATTVTVVPKTITERFENEKNVSQNSRFVACSDVNIAAIKSGVCD